MPQGAETNLLSGEHEAFTTQINQLCDVRLNAMSNPLYFSIQVHVLFPLRVEVLGLFADKIPLLSFHKTMTYLPELEGSSVGESSLGSEPNALFIESDLSDDSGPFVEERSSPINSGGAIGFRPY
ncbi:hypothetical protein K443DRAFT_11383 [Laccaria amethystina LaAM-08-1]|uniref:Unplaced genomic scaffold K443scaffold_221, whole genome shotgun sequence n=1 Tax=Laccaria amethystina LaAM-08-1 TaxID=1095629 RepID=A0A0C9WJW7_9AGAR|nr:hypothetical protein K443DRAFT_11383 [Laccaria amethystina LaAM-08-1]